MEEIHVIRDIKNSCYWCEIITYIPLKINPKRSRSTVNNKKNTWHKYMSRSVCIPQWIT